MQIVCKNKKLTIGLKQLRPKTDHKFYELQVRITFLLISTHFLQIRKEKSSPCKRQFHKMVKHTQTIRQQIANHFVGLVLKVLSFAINQQSPFVETVS